jgi:hypothetical protein
LRACLESPGDFPWHSEEIRILPGDGSYLGCFQRGMRFARNGRQMTTAMLERQVHGLRRLVGNTPLLAINYRRAGISRTVHAKYEIRREPDRGDRASRRAWAATQPS